MIDFLKNQLVKTENSLTYLVQARGKAGPATIGDIEIEIERKKEERDKLIKDITKEEEKYKSPEEAKFRIFIISSTLSKVEENLGDCQCHLVKGGSRYDVADHTQWKPFLQGDNGEAICDILNDLSKQYPLKPTYFLHGEVTNEQLVRLDEDVEDALAIIDLLILREDIRHIVAKFDRPKNVGLFLPLCHSLKSEIKEFAEAKKQYFPTFNATNNVDVPYSCFLYDELSKFVHFKRNIINTIKVKFKITNQSVEASATRGLNMGLR